MPRGKARIAGNLADVMLYTKCQSDISGILFYKGRISNYCYWFLLRPYNSAALLRCLW